MKASRPSFVVKPSSLLFFVLAGIIWLLGGLRLPQPSVLNGHVFQGNAAIHECLIDSLPEDASALFFVNPDGSTRKRDLALYFRVQYDLAPHLISAQLPGDENFAPFEWYIAWLGKKHDYPALAQSNGWVLVSMCDEAALLRRSPTTVEQP